MIANPWLSFRPSDPSRDYLAILSELPLKSFRHAGLFLNFSAQIQKQLKTASGLLGYSMAVRILQKRFWTLSVWEDEAALHRFVGEVPHRQVMDAMHGKMGATRFVTWKLRGSELPPKWQDAFERRDRSPEA